MRRRYLVIGLAAVGTVALVSSALGGPSLKSLVEKEVAKQLAGTSAVTLKAKKGPRGPAGPAGPAGSAGAPGAPGAPGTARAYARVEAHILTPCSPDCSVSIAMGVTNVTRLGVGDYCVDAAGVSALTVSAAVTVDYGQSNSPEGNASAMADGACNGTGFEVRTERLPTGGPISAEAVDDVGFTIVIP